MIRIKEMGIQGVEGDKKLGASFSRFEKNLFSSNEFFGGQDQETRYSKTL
jgi:hypothetical protein